MYTSWDAIKLQQCNNWTVTITHYKTTNLQNMSKYMLERTHVSCACWRSSWYHHKLPLRQPECNLLATLMFVEAETNNLKLFWLVGLRPFGCSIFIWKSLFILCLSVFSFNISNLGPINKFQEDAKPIYSQTMKISIYRHLHNFTHNEDLNWPKNPKMTKNIRHVNEPMLAEMLNIVGFHLPTQMPSR